jgi:hypothetical protein
VTGGTTGRTVLLRVAVALAVAGLIGVLPLLFVGFSPLTMGIGLFVGFPALILADVAYVVVVFNDLRRHELL